VEPTDAFDAQFRPASEVVRRRWERIALAHRRGEAMPPIVLRRQPDGYYVVDGRHRVSVARALRLGDIDAWVTGPKSEPAGGLEPPTP
jgi:ParB-like chromosome segregation protein Spo0J